MISRLAVPLLAVLVAGGCSARDATAPSGHDMRLDLSSSEDQSSSEAPVKVAFEKWFTTYPAMIGNTSYGPGTFAGTILSRTVSADGVIVHLQALYMVTDPSGRDHSFAALIEGDENLKTSKAVLNGVVAEGWMTGAPVRVTFRVITPCALAIGPSGKGTCFPRAPSAFDRWGKTTVNRWQVSTSLAGRLTQLRYVGLQGRGDRNMGWVIEVGRQCGMVWERYNNPVRESSGAIGEIGTALQILHDGYPPDQRPACFKVFVDALRADAGFEAEPRDV